MQQLKMETFSVIIFTLIIFSPCDSGRCPCIDPPLTVPTCDCPPVPKGTHSPGDKEPCKREINPNLHPHPGTWYKDSESGKNYYHLGKTLYVERSDGYYLKWVTSGDGADWTLNDNYLRQWDENGRWYTLKGTSCKCEDPIDVKDNELPDAEGKYGPTGVREGVLEPPRKVFDS